MDALLPNEMADKAEVIGVRKAALPFISLFALAILAGAFIGLGAMFATTTAAATSTLPYGVARLLIGMVFCLGLILVVVGGAELFTGNNLIVMAWASRKISTISLLRNWLIVYLGNFVGSLGTAGLVFLGKQYLSGGICRGSCFKNCSRKGQSWLCSGAGVGYHVQRPGLSCYLAYL